MTPQDLIQRDRKLIWHPYSQHGLNKEIIPVARAQGAYLQLTDGRSVLDAISSWWVNIHGHSHPDVVRAISQQASKLEHVIFAGFSHEPAVELAELLLSHSAIQGMGMSKVFYSDNGSTAVEVALKMAYQYHLNRGEKVRPRFLALSESYHGDTLGAMAVGEPSGLHSIFRPLMPDVDFFAPGDLDALASLIQKNPGAYSAFIFEPMVQGVAGMKMHSAKFLEDAAELCRENGILVIADEVFTGFYRTGKCFALQHTRVKPDFICLSKGITAGFLPLAVTLVHEGIFEAFLSKEVKTAFLHGHSYTANPIACAAAVASWHLLQSEDCRKQVEMISSVTQARIKKIKDLPGVRTARCLGTIGAVELENQSNYYTASASSVMDRALRQDVLIRPLGNVLYSLPPYCVTPSEVHRIFDVIEGLIVGD